MSNQDVTKKPGFMIRFLNGLERVGNKMCDPITLFVGAIVLIIIISAVFGGASVVSPIDGSNVVIQSLLTYENIVWIFSSFVSTVQNFSLLPMCLVVMVGIGLFESTGCAEAVLRTSVLKLPRALIVPMLLFISINSNIAGDAGFILMPTIGAMVFSALGKHPIAGAALCYAGVAGGFSANMIVGSTDALCIGFTGPAAQLVDPEYKVSMMMNFYFIAASALFLVPVGTLVNNLIVEKRFGKYHGTAEIAEKLSPEQKRGLKWAGISFFILIAFIVALCIPASSPMRDPSTGGLLDYGGGFMQSIVFLIAIIFFVPSVFYGFGAKVFRNDKDLAAAMAQAMSRQGSFIAFCIVVSQMISYFGKSNIGTYLAVAGANFLSHIGLTGVPLFILFILICALINLLIASNSAKWAILAPVFIPMFMILGYNPAFTQAMYRIGDSITNPITPMMAYFGLLVGLAKKYDKEAGIGSLMASLLPYSVCFLICWSIFIIFWFVFKLPLGPGYGIYL